MSHRSVSPSLRLAYFFVLWFCLLVTPSFAQDKYLDIQEVKSANGLSAWLVEDHSIPVISMSFSFEYAGAKNDPADKQGLSRLASNTMDEGAADLDSQHFQKILQDLSISLSFSTARDSFGGSVKTLTRNKDKAFNLLRLALTQPRFDDEPVERMRAANLSRIRASMTDPNWIAARIQNDRIFEGHPYALNSGGTLSSMAAITPQDLRKFHKTLGKNNLKIAVAGDISAQELSALLDTVFGAMPNVNSTPAEKTDLKNTGKTYIFQKDIPQSVIEITQGGIKRNDPDYDKAQVMNYILGASGFGSRLMEEVREKRGLTYGIYTYLSMFDAVSSMNISTSTVNASVPEVLNIIKDEWQKMSATPVKDQELNDAKSYLIGSLPLSLTSTDSIAGLMLSLQMDNLPIDYLDARAKRIAGITVQDVQAIAKRLLSSDAFTTIIVGQPGDIEGAIEMKELPNVE